MTSPAAPHVNQTDSDVHIIDIDIDIENIIGNTCDKEEEEPVVKAKVDNVIENDTTKKKNGTISSVKAKPFNAAGAVQKARDTFNRGVTRPVEWRRRQLKNLRRMYVEQESAMLEALHKDLRRCKAEGMVLEVDYLVNDLINTLHYLDDWMKPTWPSKDPVHLLDEVVIYKEPYGVVLVIGAWNYPMVLLLLPLAGAIAAGNTVILKPSEVAVACAAFIVETLPKYVDTDAIILVEGGPQETAELLKQKIDYIFYTGSTSVGKIVYEAAAKNLIPVTLELGGKSPVYIDNSVDVMVSARRILWGKFINAGQTCVAPDYVLCCQDIEDEFLEAARKVIKEWYGEDPQNSPDYARIINSRHFSRLVALIDASKDKVFVGGNYDESKLYIAPTVIANVTSSDKIMHDEIFGPILPVLAVKNAYEAVKFINERGPPLVIYVFSNKRSVQKLFTEQTRSGSISINETIIFYGIDALPFGGVGSSGMGVYHSKCTFDTFTHKKSCMRKNFFPIAEKIASSRYPPYSEGKLKFVRMILRKRLGPSLKYLPHLLAFALGVGLTYGIYSRNAVATEDL